MLHQEVALAIRNNTPIILMQQTPETVTFFQHLSNEKISIAMTIEEAIEQVRNLVG